jgi:hypothetical protein
MGDELKKKKKLLGKQKKKKKKIKETHELEQY